MLITFFSFQSDLFHGDTSKVFSRMHITHNMAELALNKSHRYSFENPSNIYLEEHKYLLSRMVQEGNTNFSSMCLAVIPSTGTWVDIDCHRTFINVTFLCDHSISSHFTCVKECDKDSGDFYCDKGWFWSYEVCLSLAYIKKAYIEKHDLDFACETVGGRSATEKYLIENFSPEIIIEFAAQSLSYHDSNYLIKLHEGSKVDIYTHATSISHISSLFHKSRFDLPVTVEKGLEVGVICTKEPMPIRHSCEDGLKPCDNGECILETYFCDSIPQCKDSSDEMNCTDFCSDPNLQSLYFRCQDNSCIPISRLCDLI